MWKATVFLQEQTFESFKEAVRHIYEMVTNAIRQGKMSVNALESTIWIKTPRGKLMDFYTLRDEADPAWFREWEAASTVLPAFEEQEH